MKIVAYLLQWVNGMVRIGNKCTERGEEGRSGKEGSHYGILVTILSGGKLSHKIYMNHQLEVFMYLLINPYYPGLRLFFW